MVSLSIFAASGWHELLMFAMAVLSALVLAMAVPVRSRGIEADLAVSGPHVAQGDDVDIRMTLRSSVSVARGNGTIVLPIGGRRHRMAVPPLCAHRERGIDLRLDAPPRSRLTVGPLSIRHADPFGLICHERRLCESVTVHVHPRIVPLSRSSVGHIRDLDSDIASGIADDGLSFHGLRPYVPGDDMRGVHWLSTAKTGAPMIRQYDRAHHALTTLRFSADSDGYRGREEFELAVSIAASIGVHCLNRHDSLTVEIPPERVAARDAASFLDLCSGIAPLTDPSPRPEATVPATRHDASLHCHVVGSRHDIRALRSQTAALHPKAARIIVMAHAGAEPSIESHPHATALTVGALDQLPGLWKAVG